MRDILYPILRFLDASNLRDVDALLACLTDTVRLDTHEGGWVRATADGKAALAGLARVGVVACVERRQIAVHAIAVGVTTLIEIDHSATIAANPPTAGAPGGPWRCRTPRLSG